MSETVSHPFIVAFDLSKVEPPNFGVLVSQKQIESAAIKNGFRLRILYIGDNYMISVDLDVSKVKT